MTFGLTVNFRDRVRVAAYTRAIPGLRQTTRRMAMNREQTLRILNALANGIHPATGEKFGADSPYQHPDTVRALFEAMRAMEGAAAPAPSPTAAPVSARRQPMPESGSGSRWSAEEEQRLVNSFDTGRTVDELARAHNRSRAAIEARLVRLGKMDPSAVTSALRYPPKAGGSQAQQGT